MSKTPPIPKEQRAFGQPGADPRGAAHDRRDGRTGVQSPDPGDADVHLDKQGRYGNLKQNITPQWKTQNR